MNSEETSRVGSHQNGDVAATDAKERIKVQGSGVGGQNRSVRARVRLLTLGSIQVPNVVALLSLDTTGANANPYIAGYVGDSVLRRFNVTFDYAQERLVFEKNVNYDKAIRSRTRQARNHQYVGVISKYFHETDGVLVARMRAQSSFEEDE